MVVNGEFAARKGHFLQALHIGEILSGVFLRLLRDEQGEVEIVETERVVVELVYVGEEADVFGGSFCQVVFSFCSRSAVKYCVNFDVADLADSQPLRDRHPDLAETCRRWR